MIKVGYHLAFLISSIGVLKRASFQRHLKKSTISPITQLTFDTDVAMWQNGFALSG